MTRFDSNALLPVSPLSRTVKSGTTSRELEISASRTEYVRDSEDIHHEIDGAIMAISLSKHSLRTTQGGNGMSSE